MTTDVRARWEARRAEWQHLGATVNGASICVEILRDLDALERTSADECLTLSEAAACSGYTADHLGRLIREDKIENVGRKGAPRVRQGDLPKKAAKPLARPATDSYDPIADARKLGSRRKGGT